jgi:hypothetical protein
VHDFKLISFIGLVVCSPCFGSENILPKVIEETSTHTLTREVSQGTIVTRVTGPSRRTERVTPLIYIDKKMVVQLGKMIKDKSSELYKKALPPIRMNVGTRVFEEGSEGSPGFGTSISFPLYSPGEDADEDKKKQAYLKALLGYLRDLELNQKLFESQMEKLGIIKKLMIQEQTPDRLDAYYKTEGDVLKVVSDLNMIIRFFEYQLDINFKELKEKVHKNG